MPGLHRLSVAAQLGVVSGQRGKKKKGIFQSAVMIVSSPFLFDVVEFGGSDSSTPTPRLLHLCLSGCCALVCIFVYA